MKPNPSTYGTYFGRYIDLVPQTDLSEAFNAITEESYAFWLNLTEEQGNYRYAEGKWSIKELLLHIIDTERIFSYRALAIARGETTPLPGYDENQYATHSAADSRSMEELVDEFFSVRNATMLLFNSFTDEALNRVGKANGNPLTAAAAGFIIIGHEIHHMNVVKERYLQD
ncbi:MAG: DinB family protein [Flavobacteriales bacterium]|nr:DinB family protein [Flavobacteriales bacterium]